MYHMYKSLLEMGHELRHMWDTRRLLWFLGVAFAVVIICQHFEFPYGDVISSLFSANKTELPSVNRMPVGDPFHHLAGNFTLIDSSNFTQANDSHASRNITTSEVKVVELGNNFESERNGPSNEFTEQEEDHVSRDGFSLKNSELNQNSTTEDVKTKNLSIPLIILPPIGSPTPLPHPTEMDTTVSPSEFSLNLKDGPNSLDNGESDPLERDTVPVNKSSSIAEVSYVKKSNGSPLGEVVSISEMNDMLLQIRASAHFVKPRWSSTVDQELLKAKFEIENAPIVENDPSLHASIYRNISMFKKSYELMEKTLKVYIYKEGQRPIFHQPVLKGIYASEGWFMKQIKGNKQFFTKNARRAHLFYMPFSSRRLEETLYVPNSHSHDNLVEYLKNYLDMIMMRYPFWNRTSGADHFLVACHDWAPAETRQIMNSCIRALCNADVKAEGFQLGKDVSLPETYVRSAQNPLREVGGKPPSQRPVLAFFAGGMHGYLRPILLKHWENKDPDMKIFGYLPKAKGNRNYIQYMKTSKYCICAKGYEVNSPRVVEAIFYECVPVIISDNFVPPFFEVLNWESFAVFVQEKDIPRLRDILLSITNKRYLEMQQRVKQVQQHFLWHVRPVKYDVFHMILHSIWYNRVFQLRPQ